MRLFDVDEYTLPSNESVDLQKTKESVGIFLVAYKTNWERLGMPAYPKLTQEFCLVCSPDQVVKNMSEGIELTIYEKEYLKTEQCFSHAFQQLCTRSALKLQSGGGVFFFIAICMDYQFLLSARGLIIKKTL